jgi:hypothetical protein
MGEGRVSGRVGENTARSGGCSGKLMVPGTFFSSRDLSRRHYHRQVLPWQ